MKQTTMMAASTELPDPHSASGHCHRHHHIVHRSSTGQLMDSRRQRQREERERWLGQWANIWTKRQSPEWKPRRASVASCQQRRQQQQQQQIYDLSTVNGDNVDLRKFIGQKIQQSRGSHLRQADGQTCAPENRAQSAIELSWGDVRKLSLQEGAQSGQAASRSPSAQCQNQGLAHSPANQDGGRLIEKLEFQDKQRKSLIFSMALRQMIADGAASGGSDGVGGKGTGNAAQVYGECGHSQPSLVTVTGSGGSGAPSVQQRDKQQLEFVSLSAKTSELAAQVAAQVISAASETVSSYPLLRSPSRTTTTTAATLTCCLAESDRNKGDAVNGQRAMGGDFRQDDSIRPLAEDEFATANSAEIETAAGSASQVERRNASMMSIVVDQNYDRQQSVQQDDTSGKRESNLAPEQQGPRRRLSSGLGADSSIHSTGSCDIEPNLSEFDSDEQDESELQRQQAAVANKDEQIPTTDPQQQDSNANNEPRARMRRCHCDQQQVAAKSFTKGEDEVDFESLIVESWLDDHPSFVHDYFMRKANRQLIDDWLVTHAKSAVSANLHSAASYEHLRQPPTPTSCGYNLTRGDSDSATTRTQQHYSSVLNQPAALTLFEGQSLMSSNLQRSARTYTRSSSQSGQATPVRKISATDFESRSGSGFLRPMVSTTPDGRPTFLAASNQFDYDHDLEQYQQQKTDAGDGDKAQASDSETLERRDSSDFSAITGDDSTSANDMPADKEMKLIFELVKNICNDLDINTLLHKILKNIAVLINADKSSLFLVCGESGDPNRRLVSQLFNVDQEDSDFEGGDPISIPWGTGLVGYVAASGESVNIDNCYDDPRFTNTIDQRTGYVTKHMLCSPIFDKRNEIVGVAQVINKRDGKPFTKSDETKFKRYLQFCGIGLRNAQSYENCQLENRRNQVLLDLARMVFEEQSTIEQVVYRIMLHTQSLLECQRCQVLLIDDGSSDLDHLLQLPSRAAAGVAKSTTTTTGQQLMQPKPDWRPQFAAANRTASSNAPTNDNNNNNGPTTTDHPSDQDGHVNPIDGGDLREDRCADSAVSDSMQLDQQHQAKCSPKLFSLVFDLECDGNDLVMHSNKDGPSFSSPTAGSQRFPINIGITSYVAMTGETLNIEDAHRSERFDPSVDEGTNFRHKSILCMPIRNGQRQIIGVSQLINKKNGRPFNKNDEDLFEAFAIFCGLGIHNTLMYEKVLKIMAKQRVTFEVLSYHATAPLEEAKKLNKEPIPSCYALNLTSLKFNDFSLDEQFMLKSCLRFFLDLDLMRRFQIDQLVFCNWILSVQKNYRKVTYHPIVGGNGLKASPVRYHNWRHAFNVTQMMFSILINTQICRALGELETLALLIACLCHDLDHRGTNNSFQIKSASPLAELYSTSTMEHHHFDQCVMILNSQGNQILANLSPEEYSRVIVLLEEAILATDLANYFQKREIFFRLVNSNQFDWRHNQEHRSLLRCMLMTACDVAAITKPWPVQKVVADLVMSEFYQQGDIERQELNIEPIDMMNRDKMSKLPEMQIGFIDSICAPIYVAFARLFPNELSPLLDGCLSNRNLWAEIAKSNNNNNNNNQAKLGDNQPP